MLFEEYNVETALQVREEEATKRAMEKVALKMLKSGDSLEKIQTITDLPTKRIMELKKQLELQPVNS